MLCDQKNWSEYKSPKAKYAVGSPSVEMLAASRYNDQVEDFKSASYTKTGLRQVTYQGYPHSETLGSAVVRTTFFEIGESYLIASPGKGWPGNWYIVEWYQNATNGQVYSQNPITGMKSRPVVCISPYLLEISGTGSSKTLSIATE